MRKNGPMVNRWLYGLMCLLLVLNYGTPLMALAEDVNSDGQLMLGEVKQTSQQEMTLALQGKAQPVTQEVVVHYSVVPMCQSKLHIGQRPIIRARFKWMTRRNRFKLN